MNGCSSHGGYFTTTLSFFVISSKASNQQIYLTLKVASQKDDKREAIMIHDSGSEHTELSAPFQKYMAVQRSPPRRREKKLRVANV